MWRLLAVAVLVAGCARPQSPEAVSAETDAKPLANSFLVDAGELDGGVVVVTARYEGEPPNVPMLKKGTDPACEGGEAREQTAVLGEGGALANVVVSFVGPDAPKGPLPAAPVALDQKACTYVPHVVAGVVGQSLEVESSDFTLHNVHGKKPKGESWFNAAQLPGSAKVRRALSSAGAFRVGCDVHPWMSAWVVVVDSPFVAVSGLDGRAVLTAVPPGHYRLRAWHERFGVKEAEVDVHPSGTETPVTFVFGQSRK